MEKFLDPSWAMLIGSMCTLYFTVKMYKEKAGAYRAGVAITNMAKDGSAEIRNRSLVDCAVKLENLALSNQEIINDFLRSKNKRDFIKEKIDSASSWHEIVPEQALASGEAIGFNINSQNSAPADAQIIFLKFLFNGKTRYYVYRFLKNNWNKLYSFE